MGEKPMVPETYTWIYHPPAPIVGLLLLTFTPDGLASLDFVNGDVAPAPHDTVAIPFAPQIELVQRELAAYFSSRPTDFKAIALDLQGTPFQLRVWQELRRLPWGTTVSYQELARRLGNPQGSRAVGQAVGANPVAIIIPCHRVIAARGKLGGYGGGLERKRWLLEHEGAVVGGGPGA